MPFYFKQSFPQRFAVYAFPAALHFRNHLKSRLHCDLFYFISDASNCMRPILLNCSHPSGILRLILDFSASSYSTLVWGYYLLYSPDVTWMLITSRPHKTSASKVYFPISCFLSFQVTVEPRPISGTAEQRPYYHSVLIRPRIHLLKRKPSDIFIWVSFSVIYATVRPPATTLPSDHRRQKMKTALSVYPG